MSKVIKVDNQVYDVLDMLRTGRQTFSDIIEELIFARIKMLETMDTLERVLRFREWQRGKIEKSQTKDE